MSLELKQILDCVSRETQVMLSRYVALIEEWSAAINLVSSNEELWHRHINDSAQLVNYIESSEEKNIIDFGSGGGLPGIVLAILLPNPVVMIEADRRKALFLRHCMLELGLKNTRVINERIEAIEGFEADYVVARALAPLDRLLEYTHRFFHVNTICLFPKGKNYSTELEKAESQWGFQREVLPSVSGDGVLLKIKKINKKREDDKGT